MSHYTTPTPARLLERLQQLGAVEKGVTQLTAEEAEQAIRDMLASEAVCCRCTVDGKPRVLRFREMWELVYKRRWIQLDRFAADPPKQARP